MCWRGCCASRSARGAVGAVGDAGEASGAACGGGVRVAAEQGGEGAGDWERGEPPEEWRLPEIGWLAPESAEEPAAGTSDDLVGCSLADPAALADSTNS
jgi:hypothetical protein